MIATISYIHFTKKFAIVAPRKFESTPLRVIWQFFRNGGDSVKPSFCHPEPNADI